MSSSKTWGVVAWRERSGWGHASTRSEKLDRGAGADSRVEESAVEAPASTCCGACPALSDEASFGTVRVPGWDAAASGGISRSGA